MKFSIKALTAQASAISVSGKAVLTKAGKIIKTWKIDKSTTHVDWNGLVGKKLDPGLYKLTITAQADGVIKKASTTVRVVSEHLVTKTVMVKSKISPTAITGSMPKVVAQAFTKGKVTVRVRTVAKVHGKARLLFSNNGVKRSIALLNGTHTTASLTVPKGFKVVKITHQWKKGSVKLISYTDIWTYQKLVH